jgi:flagellin
MYNINVKDRARVSEKLSSGYRIHRAADDAAGLGISEKMRRQIHGLTQAVANAQDGISLLQSAEGALNEVHDMLQRMNELCVKAANDTISISDRSYIQSEIMVLQDEINRSGETTTFNEIKVLNGIKQEDVTAVSPNLEYTGFQNQSLQQASGDDPACFSISPLRDGDILTKEINGETVYFAVNGSGDGDGTSGSPFRITKEEAYRHVSNQLLEANASVAAEHDGFVSVSYSTSGPDEGKFFIEFHAPLELKLQVGSETEEENQITLTINPLNSATLGIHRVDVTGPTNDGALKGIEAIKDAIKINSRERSNLGSAQNRLEYTIKNLNNVVENTQDAESKLRDTEMAHTISDYMNKDVLVQAGQMILSQANQSKEVVLRLLQ